MIHEFRLVITSHISYSNISFYTVKNIQLRCSLCLQNLPNVIKFSGTLCNIFSVDVTYTATSCCSRSVLFLGYNPRPAPLNFFIPSTGVTLWSVPSPCQNNHLYGYAVKNAFPKKIPNIPHSYLCQYKVKIDKHVSQIFIFD